MLKQETARTIVYFCSAYFASKNSYIYQTDNQSFININSYSQLYLRQTWPKYKFTLIGNNIAQVALM